jgi:hypothetical protein
MLAPARRYFVTAAPMQRDTCHSHVSSAGLQGTRDRRTARSLPICAMNEGVT